MHLRYIYQRVKIRLALILVLPGFLVASVNAQQKKSLDEIDNASFKAGRAPFESTCIPVKLSPKPLKQPDAPLDIILTGQWQMVEGGSETERLNKPWFGIINAEVPGSVHTALWKAGIIPDPYFGRNDTIANKNSFKTWWFKKEFTVDMKVNNPRLIFDGVAVHCTVWLNGIRLGEHEGMFGGPYFDVSKYLSKKNILIVKIDPAPHLLGTENDFFKGMNIGWRKTVVFNCVYGWHYSNIPAIGIWRTVKIQNQADVEIDPLFITTKDTNALMNLQVILRKISTSIAGKLLVVIKPENFTGMEQSFEYPVSSTSNADTLRFSFTILDPQLWWPNDLGKQNLYKLKVSFLPEKGKVPDLSETLFGIRTIKMEPLPGGPDPDKFNWTFVINGRNHFIKGTGWCTMDPLMNFSSERYNRFLTLAKLQHIQMFRAWGGGMPETNEFYDLCDLYGILVYQEWPTAWNSHEEQPYDVFLETVRLNTIRLRNHPSLALWGGGNESDKPFGKIIDMMGRLSIELDGTRAFHRIDAWGGSDHNYYVYWGGMHLDNNLTMKADFWGEFGIAAFPVKESVLRYLPENEKLQWPPDSTKSFVHHTPVFGLKGDMKTLSRCSGYVMPNNNMDDLIIGSQLTQVVGVRHTLELARTRWPDCTGALYYKMNDNYPAASWSCVDWYGAPKPLHYFVQDAFSPVASVVLFEKTDMSNQKAFLPIFLLDDKLDLANSDWKVTVRAFDQNLKEIKIMEYNGTGNHKQVNKLGEITLSYKQLQTSPLLIVSDVKTNNKLLYRTFYFMNFEKDKGCLFKLPYTSLRMNIVGNKAVITNTGSLPAVAVNIQCPGKADQFTASDNYFWLDPGESMEVEVNKSEGLIIDAWNLGAKADNNRVSQLMVSANGHYLQTSNDKPFFYLGDQEWTLNKHSDAQIANILDDRVAKGFTVIQTSATRNWDDNRRTDYNGNLPFVNNDVTQFNTAYWNRLKIIADSCATRGLYIALNVGESGRMEAPWFALNSGQCYEYGRKTGETFRGKTNIIFNIGQDMRGTKGVGLTGWRAIAEGVADGYNNVNNFDNSADYSTTFMDFHPDGGPPYSSSAYFHTDVWLDANGIEVWHATGTVYEVVIGDYNKTGPVKPALLVEGWYEAEDSCTAKMVRVEAWHTSFAGGFYGYGHYENWHQYTNLNYLNSTGAQNMGTLARFMKAREWWKLVPDQEMIVSGEGSGAARKAAVKSTDGEACYVYYPEIEVAGIMMNRITTGTKVVATWFDPRNGNAQPGGTYAKTQTVRLTPPAGWEDAVLQLNAQ
jgi:beta-mannosidase